jgi:8-oxo-dGTP pyrophosphatase MutT (NUDIX family)
VNKNLQEIVDRERGGSHAAVEPNDAATLIIVDRSADVPKVLMGRRHERQVFLPGKFVFPGGSVDSTDREMTAAKPLRADIERRLLSSASLASKRDAMALALAAIRETFEETGLVIGDKVKGQGVVPPGPWSEFVRCGYYPDPSALRFIARAITPPGFVRRFDARFFCVDAAAIAYRRENVIHADAELVELKWLPISDALRLDLPVVTELVLAGLEIRLRSRECADPPVPFYATRCGKFTCESIT